MRRTGLFLMVIAVLFKLLGFGGEMVLSLFYGASAIIDAYLKY